MISNNSNLYSTPWLITLHTLCHVIPTTLFYRWEKPRLSKLRNLSRWKLRLEESSIRTQIWKLPGWCSQQVRGRCWKPTLQKKGTTPLGVLKSMKLESNSTNPLYFQVIANSTVKYLGAKKNERPESFPVLVGQISALKVFCSLSWVNLGRGKRGRRCYPGAKEALDRGSRSRCKLWV